MQSSWSYALPREHGSYNQIRLSPTQVNPSFTADGGSKSDSHSKKG